MAGRDEFVELLDIQGSLDLITRQQLLEQARAQGARLTERQLTTYVTEGLLPRSGRLGERAGVYPSLVLELLMLITTARRAGTSIDAIREFIPVWKYLVRARRDGSIDLSEFEDVVSEHITLPGAAFSVPWLFGSVLDVESRWAPRGSPPDRLPSTVDVHDEGTPVSDTVPFVVGLGDDGDEPLLPLARMQVTLTTNRDGTSPEEKKEIVVSIPRGDDPADG